MTFLRIISVAVLTVGLLMTGGRAEAQGLIRDAEIERTLAQMSYPLYKAAGLSPSTVEMYIINDRSLNAFVASGRNIFLNTGLLITLDTPEELQGVIAHEIGHITGGHIARRAIKLRNAQGPAIIGALAGIAIAAAGGGAAGAAISAGSQGVLIRDILRHSRAEEASADQAAINYLRRSNIDPSGLRRVFERFQGQEAFTVGNVDPYAVTHPLSSQRLQLIDRRLSEVDSSTIRRNEETAYWHARMRSKLDGFLNSPERVLDILDRQEPSEFTLYARAIALHRVPSPQEAVDAVDRLIALRPDDPFYIELKGQILFESGDAVSATPLYRKASRLAPSEPL
ncbi:MAG: M48 family metalloprotease, partial [Pseudomonadota bacterium]